MDLGVNVQSICFEYNDFWGIVKIGTESDCLETIDNTRIWRFYRIHSIEGFLRHKDYKKLHHSIQSLNIIRKIQLVLKVNIK